MRRDRARPAVAEQAQDRIEVRAQAAGAPVAERAERVGQARLDAGDERRYARYKPGGKINDNATDCTWTSCIGRAPDWGVIGSTADDPSKDVDNTGPYGPENILLDGPEAGTYTVMVEHWNANGSPMSDGTVILNVAGEPAVVQRMMDLAPYHVWTAATITFPGGVVTPSSAVHDCSANWASGCRDSIPWPGSLRARTGPRRGAWDRRPRWRPSSLRR